MQVLQGRRNKQKGQGIISDFMFVMFGSAYKTQSKSRMDSISNSASELLFVTKMYIFDKFINLICSPLGVIARVSASIKSLNALLIEVILSWLVICNTLLSWIRISDIEISSVTVSGNSIMPGIKRTIISVLLSG